MDHELKARLASYLDTLESTVKSGSDFLVEQAPLYVREYLNWTFWSSMFIGVVCAAIFWFMVLASKAAYKKVVENMYPYNDSLTASWTAVLIMMVACSLLSLIFTVTSFYTATKVTLAPRVVLMER